MQGEFPTLFVQTPDGVLGPAHGPREHPPSAKPSRLEESMYSTTLQCTLQNCPELSFRDAKPELRRGLNGEHHSPGERWSEYESHVVRVHTNFLF